MDMKSRDKRIVALLPLALAAALAASPAASEIDPNSEQELVAHGRRIDAAAPRGESAPATAKLVEQWKGTEFTFERNTAPRELTPADVQALRQKGLGYGEISILLALAAQQPDAASAKPLSEILAARQSGTGWGRLARQLGYSNLGSVVSSVKRTEQSMERTKPEIGRKPERSDALGKPDLDKPEKVERSERAVRPERPERPKR